MPDEPMAQQRPLAGRDQLHQVLLDLLRGRLPREPQPGGKPRHVRIHHDPDVQAKGIPEHDVAVLRPTPSSSINSAIERGTAPPWRSANLRPQA